MTTTVTKLAARGPAVGAGTRPASALARLSVKAKLAGSFTLVSVLVVATILAGLSVARSARTSAVSSQQDVAATRALKQLQLDAATVAVAENSVAFDYASHGSATGDLQSLAQGEQTYQAEAKVVAGLTLTPAEQRDLQQANAAFAQYSSLSRRVNADYATNTKASLAAAATGVAALSFGAVTTPLEHLVGLVAAHVNVATAGALSSASSGQNLVLIIGLIVILLAIASATVIVRAITRPIRALNSTLSAVTAGDLSARADVASRDELGQLAGALNEAVSAQEQARTEIDRQNAAVAEMSSDSAGVLEVLNALADADSVGTAAAVALETICASFGWAYGAYWALDPTRRGLVLAAEHGDVAGGELRRLSQGASIAEGADLDGRAWARKGLVASDGLEELADSPRAAAARRAGVRTAVAVPVLADGTVHGTLSFFGPVGGAGLSSSRTEAMANAGMVVSQAVERIGDRERERAAEAELRDKVDQILEVVSAAATGDLTVAVPVSGEDAIGRLGTSLALFLQDLRDRIRAIGENTAGVAGAIAELSGGQGSGSSAGTVETVAAAAEELTASIQEIAKSAADAARVAVEAAAAADATNTTVTSLGDSSAEIGQVIKVITLIAEQTNMLALNATIEAARAGEAGKGFAVVASEVKELARETTTATDDISARIQAIQSDAGGAVSAIGGIKEIVDRINELQSSIASAVEEQTATTNEIARGISGAAQAASDIGRMTGELEGLITRFNY